MIEIIESKFSIPISFQTFRILKTPPKVNAASLQGKVFNFLKHVFQIKFTIF